MRAWELLLESEEDKFDSDLDDLIVAAKANGLTEISVDDLVTQLNDMGHSVTADSLVNSLEHHGHEHKGIKNVTLNKITLKTHVLDDEGKKDYEGHGVDAGRIASKTAMKGVKKKNDLARQSAEGQL